MSMKLKMCNRLTEQKMETPPGFMNLGAFFLISPLLWSQLLSSLVILITILDLVNNCHHAITFLFSRSERRICMLMRFVLVLLNIKKGHSPAVLVHPLWQSWLSASFLGSTGSTGSPSAVSTVSPRVKQQRF